MSEAPFFVGRGVSPWQAGRDASGAEFEFGGALSIVTLLHITLPENIL